MYARFFTLIAVIVLLVSCKDEPILSGAGMYSNGKSSVLFTNESVYTVTSKKSGGGMTTRGGYTTCYLNAIDVNTGETIKHKKIGDFKERVEYLGEAGGKAWFFSYDPDVSLHARDPQTLEITVTVKDILAKNPSLSSGLAAEGHQTQMDTSGKYIFITTKDGYNYLVDPQTFIASKTGERSNSRFYLSSGATTNISNLDMNDSLEISFQGNTRSVLKVEQKTFNVSSFEFYSRNTNHTPNKNLYYNTKQVEVKADISFIEPRAVVNRQAPTGDGNRDPLLMNDNTLYVISKSMLGNNFNWIIAAIKAEYGNVHQAWQYELTGTEKVSYSDKDLLFASIAGNKLILVFENAMVGLDLLSGKEVWRKDVRKKD